MFDELPYRVGTTTYINDVAQKPLKQTGCKVLIYLKKIARYLSNLWVLI